MADITILGRLTRDPELREVGSSQVAKFSLADGDRFRQGRDQAPQSLFLDCEVWGGQAQVVMDYCRKGSRIKVAGQLCPSNYTNRDGVEVKATIVKVDRVTLAESKAESAGRAPGPGGNPMEVDEIPF
jgi:single-strand DNA-binding protein